MAIEVVIASGGIDKLEIYRGLNVPEVWFWQGDRFTIYQLVDTRYVQVNRTQLLPDLDLNLLVQYIRPEAEPQMVRAYRQTLQQL